MTKFTNKTNKFTYLNLLIYSLENHCAIADSGSIQFLIPCCMQLCIFHYIHKPEYLSSYPSLRTAAMLGHHLEAF